MSLINFVVITVVFALLLLSRGLAFFLNRFLEDCEVDMKYFAVIDICFFNICAMGTKYAPSYANIFIGWFEEKFIFPFLANLSDFYLVL